MTHHSKGEAGGPRYSKRSKTLESKNAAREKAKAVMEELRSMKLKEAAPKVEDGIEKTLALLRFSSEY